MLAANANDAPILADAAVWLADATPEDIGRVIALGAGLLSHKTSVTQARRTLQNIGSCLAPEAATPTARIRLRIAAIAEEGGYTFKEIVGPVRTRDLVHLRHKAMWSLRTEHNLSFPRIGRLFNRDHSTVVHGVRAHAARLAQDPGYSPPPPVHRGPRRDPRDGWSEGERNIIRRFYVWHSDKEIANALLDGGFPRTGNGVKNARIRMNLYRTEAGLQRAMARSQAAE